MARCQSCGIQLKPGNALIPVYTLVRSERRGDHIQQVMNAFKHLDCEKPALTVKERFTRG